MRIQLIHPPIDPEYMGYNVTKWGAPPTHLEIIAKAIERRRDRDTKIEIIDGNKLSLDQIIARLDGDWIGATSWYSSHNNSLRILKHASQKGAQTVIGGPNVEFIASRILKSHEFVNYVVVREGEDATSRLVNGEDVAEIPNLVYRNSSGGIIRNPIKSPSLDIVFDLEHLLWRSYDSSETPVPISSIRGCVKAAKGGRCSFCSMKNQFRVMDPILAWEQIRLLYERYGFDYFFETGDSFVAADFPQRFLVARPSDLSHIKFRLYASTNQITPEIVEIFKKLNVKHLFLGLESASDVILREARKNYRKKDIDHALDLLCEENMDLHIPFMYGLPGETPETLEQNQEYARQITKRRPNIFLLTSKAIPVAGSDLFIKLATNENVRKEYKGDLDNDDHFDYKQLMRLQTKYRTSVTYEQIEEAVKETIALVGLGRSPGFGETRMVERV